MPEHIGLNAGNLILRLLELELTLLFPVGFGSALFCYWDAPWEGKCFEGEGAFCSHFLKLSAWERTDPQFQKPCSQYLMQPLKRAFHIFFFSFSSFFLCFVFNICFRYAILRSGFNPSYALKSLFCIAGLFNHIISKKKKKNHFQA